MEKLKKYIDYVLMVLKHGDIDEVSLLGDYSDYNKKNNLTFKIIFNGGIKIIQFSLVEEIYKEYNEELNLTGIKNIIKLNFNEDTLTTPLVGVCNNCEILDTVESYSLKYPYDCKCCEGNHVSTLMVCSNCEFDPNYKLTVDFEPIILNLKTAYHHCLDLVVRVLDLNSWDGGEESFFKEEISKVEFLDKLKKVSVKPNSMPRKTDKYLNYRMYGFVAYNLSGIQKGIQFGHSVVDYQLKLHEDEEFNSEPYYNWAKNDKTFIILNGYSTNNDKDDKFYGGIQKLRDEFLFNDILISEFYEPDMNKAMSSFCFLVDERVYDKVIYENFKSTDKPWKKGRGYSPTIKQKIEWREENEINHAKWVEKIGGPKNAFLREILNGKSLA